MAVPLIKPENLQRIVVSMMKISVRKDFYVVTLECCEIFIHEFNRLPYLSFVSALLQDLE